MMKLKIFYLFAIASLNIAKGQTNEQSQNDDSCKNHPCSCCLDNVTCPTDGDCGGQCKDGYFGGRCMNSCPSNCEKCQDVYNPNNNKTLWGVANCTECKSGYYSIIELFQCQLNCLHHCQSCMSATECTSCENGYYLSDDFCIPCPDECRSCRSHDHCESCRVGYYYSDFVCLSCPKGCISCTSPIQCLDCEDGYYLSDGVNGARNCHKCSVGCLAGTCHKTSGICQCKSTFTRPKCDRCISGRFGKDCLSYCPVNCRVDTCDRNTGSCLGGCFDGYSGDQCCLEGSGCQTCASENICAECVHGKHGIACDKDCPEDCENRVCYKDTGLCLDVRKPDNKPTAIGVGVAGAAVVIAIAVIIIVVYYKRRNRSQKLKFNTDSTSDGVNNPEYHQNEELEVANVPDAVITDKSVQPDQTISDTHLNPTYLNLDADDQESDEHPYDDVGNEMK